MLTCNENYFPRCVHSMAIIVLVLIVCIIALGRCPRATIQTIRTRTTMVIEWPHLGKQFNYRLSVLSCNGHYHPRPSDSDDNVHCMTAPRDDNSHYRSAPKEDNATLSLNKRVKTITIQNTIWTEKRENRHSRVLRMDQNLSFNFGDRLKWCLKPF